MLAARLLARLHDAEPLTAAEVTAIARFLKDNNITALPTSRRLTPLAAGLEALDGFDGTNIVELGEFRTSE